MTQFRSTYIAAPDGIALHCLECGTAEPTILFLHGFGDGAYVWSDFLLKTSAVSRCLAVDLRGHGLSSWARDHRYGIDVHMKDIAQIIRHYSISKFIVVGHSLGGEIAIRLHSEFFDNIIGAVIVDFDPDVDSDVIDSMEDMFWSSLAPFKSVAEYRKHLESFRFLPPPEVLQRLAEDSLSEGEDKLFRIRCDPAIIAMLRYGGSYPLWDAIKAIHTPTLVVRGAGSASFSPNVARAMAAAFRRGSLLEVKMAGHGVMSDNPEGFSKAVLPYIKKVLQEYDRRC